MILTQQIIHADIYTYMRIVFKYHTFFLHDGRARNLTEAILWHGGEAQKSRDAFAAMTAKQRADLLTFLGSL